MSHGRTTARVVTILSLLSCAGGALAQAPKPANGTLTAAFAAEGTVVDPIRFSAGVDHYYISQMYEQLVRVGPDLRARNWLAESWSIENADTKPIIDVKLRRGVTFHNGDPLTSADFEFSYQRLRDPKVSRWSHYQANVELFEIVDDHHFRIHFIRPDGDYVAQHLQLWAIPKKYFESVGDEGFSKAPVGTGPWRFVSRTVKEELRLEAYDGYWNKEHRPTVKNLVIKIIPEDLTRVAAFKTGAVDFIDGVSNAQVAEFKKMPGVKTATMVSGNNLYIDFASYLPDSPWRKLKVRQAAAHAIDVDAIIKSVLFGQGERYVSVGKGSTGYDAALKPLPYDMRKAKALLTEAGYPNGFETPCYNLTTPREPSFKEMGEAVFAYLGAVGIRCKVQGMEYGAWINMARRGRSSPPVMDGILSFMYSQSIPGDPGVAWSNHLHGFVAGKGWGSYSHTDDKQADELTERLKETMDLGKREALIKEIARYKSENVLGGLTTYRPIITLAWRDKVEFTPWPSPGAWRGFQEIGLKQ
jgi:peptide/nickel transport system substrate-binding protein